MSEQNGRLATTSLIEIPGGRLTNEAGANWLAMRRKGGRELGIWISPLGARSSYRTFAEQQHFWDLYRSGRGNLAARPGTSNHGLGRAVDLAAPGPMRRVVDRYGAEYGWRWGEAPSESWHVTYYGGGSARIEDVDDDLDHRSLKRGDSGDDVRQLQTWLSRRGFSLKVDGDFGEDTEDAVNRIYRAWGHEPHGRFGDVGWSIIEDKHPWRVLIEDEREMLADLYTQRRIAVRNGGWDKVDPSHLARARECKDWLRTRRKELWHAGKESGWRKYNRRRRYIIIRRAIDQEPPRAPERDEAPATGDALVSKLRGFGVKFPRMTIEEAGRAKLQLHYALAFLEKESSGRDEDGSPKMGLNLFGSDPVRNPVRGGFVTRTRYEEYRRNRRAGLGMQGVGPCQLTWWEFQDMADRAGGCWRPRHNMRVGFAIAARLIRDHGERGGARRWNGTGKDAEDYADDWLNKQRRWRERL
jgi:hypothetical protein